jgi:phage repressor protein C with HTH and peptisase S24 domain
MEPTFPNGCRVTITRLKNIRSLSSGRYYFIIDTNWQGIVRRVYQDEKDNCIRLVSDSPDQTKYPPIEKSMDQIEAIFLVGASITKL